MHILSYTSLNVFIYKIYCKYNYFFYWADAITIALEVYYKNEITVYYITYILIFDDCYVTKHHTKTDKISQRISAHLHPKQCVV